MKIYEEVTLVLISYKSRDKIKKFIKNISQNLKIIIIENSQDIKLKKDLEIYRNIKIYLQSNKGYGAAANYAKTKIKTKYFLLCNPDLENLNDDKIIKLYKIGNKIYPNFLALGPNFEFSKKNYNFNYNKETKISGSCMFFNSKKFDDLGGFDENIFLYFEEDDLCKRGNKINLYSYKLISQSVNHDIGTSVEVKTTKEKLKLKHLTLWHFIWSKYYFYKKNYGTIISFLLFLPALMRIYFKLILNLAIKDKKNFQKYKYRYDGLITSISGGKSYKRIF